MYYRVEINYNYRNLKRRFCPYTSSQIRKAQVYTYMHTAKINDRDQHTRLIHDGRKSEVNDRRHRSVVYPAHTCICIVCLSLLSYVTTRVCFLALSVASYINALIFPLASTNPSSSFSLSFSLVFFPLPLSPSVTGYIQRCDCAYTWLLARSPIRMLTRSWRIHDAFASREASSCAERIQMRSSPEFQFANDRINKCECLRKYWSPRGLRKNCKYIFLYKSFRYT